MAKSRTLTPGDLVIDSYGAKCILLCVYEQIPNDEWLARQQDPRVKKHKNGTWWKTLNVTGGGGVVAEALVNYVSRTSREDFDVACAKGPTEASILKPLFPEYAS